MGNSNNNHLIEYQTKDGIKISYLFWDMKGRNRFPQIPSDIQVSTMFQKCIQQIDISQYQLKLINEFNTKYKYRFVLLHRRKLQEYKKQHELKKMSRESYHLQIVQEVKSLESAQKIKELENLMKNVEVNQSTIKISLVKIYQFITEKSAQEEFIEIHGIQRFVELLDKAIKLNKEGTKTSFSSQIELLKFFHYFSTKYSKQFYASLPNIKSYASAILKSFHPINSQLIIYSLSLLTDYLWKSQDQNSTIFKILQKHKTENNLQSILAPFIESIIESDSILSVFYNIKFINELLASVINKQDKETLEKSLFEVKYSLVLQNIKVKLQTLQYKIQNTTFIAIYQKIFKYSQKKGEGKQKFLDDKINFQTLIEQNTRFSKNSINKLQDIHQKFIFNLLKAQGKGDIYGESLSLQQPFQGNSAKSSIICFLQQTDKKTFNKFLFQTLTQMQKFFKLQQYLLNQDFTVSTTSSTQIDQSFQQTLIQSRIKQHNLQSYFSKIKKDSNKNNTNEILIRCFQKLQFFERKQWENLQRFILEQLGQIKKINQELNMIKIKLDQKQLLIKNLLKENHELKEKNKKDDKSSENKSTTSILLQPPPNLQKTLEKQKNITITSQPLPSLSNLPNLLPPIIDLSLLLNKQPPKQKQKRKPSKPMKNCNYTILSYQKIKNSVFQQIDDTKVQINEAQLVQFFAKPNSQISVSKLENSRLTLPASINITVNILKPERLRNIEIVLTRLKIPSGQMKKTLYSFSGRYCSQSILESVQKILPTQEQQQLLKNFDGNQKDLGLCQKFYKQLIQIPQYVSRIKSLIFSHIREQTFAELQFKIKNLSKGFISLKNNTRIKCILQTCLAIGNYLNGQGIKGGAWGFKPDTIQRLQQVKSLDNKMTAAFYLIKQVWNTFSYPIFQRQQIQSYQHLSKVPLSQITQQIKQLQTYQTLIQKAYASKLPNNQSDLVQNFTLEIKNEIQQKIKLFKFQFQELQTAYLNCSEYYCEDGKKISSQQFGKKMYKCVLFVSNTQKLWKLIEEKRMKEESRRATRNNLSYVEGSEIGGGYRQSQFNIQDLENLTKTSPGFKKQKQTATTITFQRNSSSVFNFDKPQKLLSQLTQQQKAKQIYQVQQQSLNKSLETTFRRRTQKIQIINHRMSKKLPILQKITQSSS